LLVLVAGIALRLWTVMGFSPAFLVRESAYHLSFVDSWSSLSGHPVGYAVLELTPLSWVSDGLAPVIGIQHLLGLATGAALYILLLRWGVWRWLAAVATVPVMLDPYMLASEHMVLPDTLFIFLVAMALLVLGWRAVPSKLAALVGGVLLATATTVSSLAVPLVAVAFVAVLLTATTWRRRLASAFIVAIGFGVPFASFAVWEHAINGDGGLTATQTPNGVGPAGSVSPQQSNDAFTGFSALLHWSPATSGDYPDARVWQFRSYTPPATSPRIDRLYGTHGGEQLTVQQPGANAMVTYQRHVFTPGPLLLVALLLGLFAAAGGGRASSSGMRTASLFVTLVPVAMLLDAVNTVDLSWRNELPVVVLLPVAGALGLTAMLRGRRSPATGRAQLDEVDRAAMAGFHDHYGAPAFGPVVVVIAAYNEAVGLPRVLASMPTTVCGLSTDVVIVDDGSTDGTATAANTQGEAYVVTCPRNRGQGAAMRLGYRVAREGGAQYIITTDADAQYDTADFPTVLAPLLDGSADFVTGSRRLGRQHSNDRFRRAGVYVFAWIVSALTGQRLTDTSFGLRAMRADVTAAVTLNQPQYQSSELLIGAHSHGFRIAEVPGTMHLRAAGSTKKGRNLIYGTRYARVVFGTWWREGCPTPVRNRAAALRVPADS
jgi:hypothetical protein